MKRLATTLVAIATATLVACSPETSNTQESPQPEAPQTQAPPAQTEPAPTEADVTQTEVESPAPEVTTEEPEAPVTPTGTSQEDLEGMEVKASTIKSWIETPSSAPGKMVFLTFDDGPNDSRTPAIVQTLQEKGVKGTFFVVGKVIGDAPEILQAEYDSDMGICLHSQTHDYKKLYPGRKANPERIAKEWDQSLAAAQEVLGADFTTSCWRYPGGHMSWKNMEPADAALAAKGAEWIDWNAMTGDAEPKASRPTTKSAMVNMATAPIAKEVKTVVVLAHDTPDKKLTEESLPDIIDAYQEAGYAFGVIV